MSRELSVVIPVHDEAAILTTAVEELASGLASLSSSYEIIIAENGSTDGTGALASELCAARDDVRVLSIDEPNYGQALKAGIERAAGELVICEEIDLGDLQFAAAALALLRSGQVDMVIGSKLMPGANDDRPRFRHAASQVYNALLRTLLGFRGTDTHGLKAFRKEVVGPIAARCVVDRDVFASELVIRAYREGVRIREVPVQLHERRPPSVQLWRRVPRVIGNLARLTTAIGLR